MLYEHLQLQRTLESALNPKRVRPVWRGTSEQAGPKTPQVNSHGSLVRVRAMRQETSQQALVGKSQDDSFG
jgi:hypothetical protein